MGQLSKIFDTCLYYTLVIFGILVILFFVVGLPLVLVFAIPGSKNPTFSIESTTVKAYNLTSDNRLFCIINLNIRAYNPNPKKHVFDFYGIDMEVRKGKHHKLGDDRIRNFDLGSTEETIIHVEAVGLLVEVKKKIAEELMGDLLAGEGRVNVFMSGYVATDILRVRCANVVVDFSRSWTMVQRVGCKVRVIDPEY